MHKLANNFNAGEKRVTPNDIYAIASLKSGVVVGSIPPKISDTCSAAGGRSTKFELIVRRYIFHGLLLNHENPEKYLQYSIYRLFFYFLFQGSSA